jgi:hypothetical protein
MTECNIPDNLFQSVKGRKFNIDFTGGNISSDGGILPLAQLDKRLHLTSSVAAALAPFDKRQRGKVKHDYLSMLRQRVYGIAVGNEDLNDHNELRSDELLQTVCGKDKVLAGASTLSRFENRAGREQCIAVSKVLVEIFIASFKSAPKELILDFDATDDPVHGMQEGRFFHGYYDHYCFLPLYVFCGQQLLVSYLRPANIDGATHSWAILSLLVKRFREEWPDVEIIFRADSGFCRWRMLRWCEKNKVKYIIGIARNRNLEKLSSHLARKAEKQYNRTGKKAKIYCDIYYAAATWDKRRRIIAKSEYNSQGPNRRYVVTNLKGTGKYLYEELYCGRSDMENRIKEQQLDLFADRTSCHDWWANQFRLLLSSLAYILFERFRALALKSTQFSKAQCGSIRLKLLKIGAVIRRNTRKIYVSLSSAYPYKNEFTVICENIAALA